MYHNLLNCNNKMNSLEKQSVFFYRLGTLSNQVLSVLVDYSG
jgi:hypothetical protein